MSNKINTCLIGNVYVDEINELNSLGISTIKLPANKMLDDEISNHADILSFNFCNKKLFVDNCIKGELYSLSNSYDIVICDNIHSPYPFDVSLNAAVLDNRLICNVNTVNKNILIAAKERNMQIINTKQGYTKCNLCVLNNNAVITEDKGLSSLLKKYQIDVLTLEPSYVYLSDKHYGFIGGASAKISDCEMYFSGDVSAHPQINDILQFLDKYNLKPVFNKNRPLRDFGGLIAIN